MHIALTDVLTCPRCGPGFGLILLAESVSQRRVLDGSLACSNCRERYPVVDGFAELRVPPWPAASPGSPSPGSADDAMRLAALLDLSEGTGLVLVAGRDVHLAQPLAALGERFEVVVCSAAASGWPESAGVSRLAAGTPLPFFGRAFRGVAITAGAGVGWSEAARVVAPMGRLVLERAGLPAEEGGTRAGPGLDEALGQAGFELLLRTDEVLVARRISA
jgi:uncharacterized protein YbaR (Trm112 family)